MGSLDTVHPVHPLGTPLNVKLVAIDEHAWTRCSSVVRAFAHGAMGRRIDHSWGGPIELFLVPASALRLV